MAVDLRKNHDCRIALHKHLEEHGRPDVSPYLLIEVSDFLLEWERGQKADTSDSGLHLQRVSPCNYEYEYLFRSEENEPCPINGWYPIATERIKHPEKIPEYITKGILRHYKG